MPTPRAKSASKTVTKKSPARKKSAAPSASKPPAKSAARSAHTLDSVMAELRSAGSEQTRKTYARHGITGDVFGVSYATLGKLTKAIKRDHALALDLWKTGNHDARILATMIADPAQMKPAELDRWIADSPNHALADAAAGVAAKSPQGLDRAAKWRSSSKELVKRAGFSTLGSALSSGACATCAVKRPRAAAPGAIEIEVAELKALLAEIERDIHAAPNRAREAMNSALIAIGGYIPELRPAALAAAKRIGKVDIDHGDTSCKTPDAADYIAKMAAREKSKG